MSTGTIFNGKQEKAEDALSIVSGVLPPDSQLRALFIFIEDSKNALTQIRTDLTLLRLHSVDTEILGQVARKLAAICLSADGWGFDEIYRIAFDLQVFIVESLNREKSDHFWGILNRGIALLSFLVSRCESGYRHRLADSSLRASFDLAVFN